ncbi:CoA transferase [Austwickia chelonae]|uniref:CoA transferase n=1 Tax=Austwickia chelonae TaxID=100225 RepID=UPI000E24D8E5|nr:CoA transferase [Austwickia chelonae]
MKAALAQPTTAAPALHRHLSPVSGNIARAHIAPILGPRVWWVGPLDVEGLLLGALQAALTAANNLLGHDQFAVDAHQLGTWTASQEHLRVDGRSLRSTAHATKFFPCHDGWLRAHDSRPGHICPLAKCLHTDSPESLARTMTAQQAEHLIREYGGTAAAVRTPQEWLASEPGRVVSARPWIDFTVPSPSPTHTPEPPRPPGLPGIRIIDLTDLTLGPAAAQLLALLGADVLRVVPPNQEAPTGRQLDTGFGKRTAEIDLNSDSGRSRLDEIFSEADAVISSGYRRRDASSALDSTAIARRHPHLAVVDITAWGDSGPWQHEGGSDTIVQAATGIAQLYSRPVHSTEEPSDVDGTGSTLVWRPAPREPGTLPVQALNQATGYGAAAATLALIARRHTEGTAGTARLSLARTAHELLTLPSLDGPAQDIPGVLDEVDSEYGVLTYARPAVLTGGMPMDYAAPPA